MIEVLCRPRRTEPLRKKKALSKEILTCFYIMGALWKALIYASGEREIKIKLAMNLKMLL